MVGTGLLEYDGYVEVNVQIPGRDFSEDHLFLVSSMLNSKKDMPVIVGNFFIDSLNKYLKDLPQEEFETLDKTICDVARVWGGPRATKHTKNASYQGGQAAN